MRAVIFETFAMFLLGGLVMLFVFFIRSAWRHAETNERLSKRVAELERENEELRRRLEGRAS